MWLLPIKFKKCCSRYVMVGLCIVVFLYLMLPNQLLHNSRRGNALRNVSKSSTSSSLCRSLQAVVQASFRRVQHPTDCKRAKYLVCDLSSHYAGLGSMIHAVVFCHYVSYSLGRILILKQERLEGIEKFTDFIGTRLSCRVNNDYEECDMKDPALWLEAGQMNNTARILRLHLLDNQVLGLMPLHLPHSVPAEIARIVDHLGLDPTIWYIGQSVRFVIGEIKETYSNHLKNISARLEITRPLVGVHIRHGDKGYEAELIPAQKYMATVEAYYERVHPNVTTRHVYVATDDPRAVRELKLAYPTGYVFISRVDVSTEAAKSPHDLSYSSTMLEGILTDIFMLTYSDFVVCTFSSNVGRLVYELRQTVFRTNESVMPLHKNIVSLDITWYFRSPSYIYRRQYWGVIATTSVSGGIDKNIRFSKLEKGKWYEAVLEKTVEGRRIVQLFDGMVYAHSADVVIYPSRTSMTDPILTLEMERISSRYHLKTIQSNLS